MQKRETIINADRSFVPTTSHFVIMRTFMRCIWRQVEAEEGEKGATCIA